MVSLTRRSYDSLKEKETRATVIPMIISLFAVIIRRRIVKLVLFSHGKSVTSKNSFGRERRVRARLRQWAHLKIEPSTSAWNSSRPRAGGREEAARFSWPGLRHPASGCSMFLSRLNAYLHTRLYMKELRATRTFAFESCATYIDRLSSVPPSLIVPSIARSTLILHGPLTTNTAWHWSYVTVSPTDIFESIFMVLSRP